MKKTKKTVQKIRKEYIAALAIALIIMIATVTYKWMIQHTSPKITYYPTSTQTGGIIPIDTSLSFRQGASSVDVIVDTGIDQISGVQLSITYDPKVLTHVKVTSGNFFSDPIELENIVNVTTGTIDYTLAIKPGGQSAKGRGIVATISYDRVRNSEATSLMFKPLTKVTALGANTSVLKTYQTIILH